MLTIGRLADLLGVTTRTIRHYHQAGVLPEPERDASGYRSYGSDDVVRLVRVRALAAAGIPLARVVELLEADAERFAATTAEVDAVLAAKIAELEQHRRRLAALSDPDADLLSPVMRELMAVLGGWGLSEHFLRIEREALILMRTLYPTQADEWARWQLEAFADPEVREVFRLSDEAGSWAADDPRIEDLARRSVALTMRLYPVDAVEVRDWWSELDSVGYQLIDQHGNASSPAWSRITARVQELMLEAGYVLPSIGQPTGSAGPDGAAGAAG